jgi:hypothetical protein
MSSRVFPETPVTTSVEASRTSYTTPYCYVPQDIPKVLVDIVHNVRFFVFRHSAMTSMTSEDVLDRVTVDVSAKTPYCVTDVCGHV